MERKVIVTDRLTLPSRRIVQKLEAPPPGAQPGRGEGGFRVESHGDQSLKKPKKSHQSPINKKIKK